MKRQMLRFLVAVPALAAAVLPAAAAENYGRQLKVGEVVGTSIYPEGDADVFVFEAGPGYKLKVTLKVTGQVVLPPPPVGDPPVLAPLLPTLELLDPDGAVYATDVVVKLARKSAKLSAVIPSGGRWAVRAKGISGTGTATLAWKLKQAKVAPSRLVPMAGAETRMFPFAATGGATVSWKLSFKGDGAAQGNRILDPDGAVVPFDPADPAYVIRKLTSEKVSNVPIPVAAPGGFFDMEVVNALAPSLVNLSIKVALPKLPKSSANLTLDEPRLTGVSTDSSACGIPIELTGQNLDASPQGILFGSEFATDVVVAPDGKSATCTIPLGTGTVDIVYVAADGQQAALQDAFTYLPFPTLTGISPTSGPGVGGIELSVFGLGFLQVQGLYDVVVGGVEAQSVTVLSETEIRCIVPAHVSGPKTVVLRNACGETATAPVQFVYGSGLNISTVVPSAVPTFGGVAVTVYGTGFQATDQVYLDGAPVPTTPVTYTGSVIGHRVEAANLPGHAPGAVDVKVVAASATQATRVGGLAYFTFADGTAASIPAASATDDWGGVSMAAVDRDFNGVVDHILVSHGTSLSLTRPGTRVLVNDGSGVFTDGTSTTVPAASATEDYGALQVLAGRFNNDTVPDVFLVRPGTGDEARLEGSKQRVDAWSRMFLGNAGGGYDAQPHNGVDSKFIIFGTLVYSGFGGNERCFLFDFDFRGVAAGLGDLDGDLDQDIALVNDRSIKFFKGTNCNYVWVTCLGYYPACYTFQTYDIGSALRFVTLGSTGGAFDRTQNLLAAAFTGNDDFRGVACTVADMNADFLNDVVVTHNAPPGPTATTGSATRVFRQTSSGVQVSYTKLNGFLPSPSGAGDDDWRGDAVAAPDLNVDSHRDLVIGLNGAVPNGRAISTRILIQNSATSQMEDRTDALLASHFPAGDDGRSRFILAVDFDKDGDQDLFLSTPDAVGTGNRRTRFLLNAGRDGATGLPILLDASGLLPPESSDAGNAVALAAGDVDGDGDLDLILTDTHQTSGTPVKRTRIWKQVR